MASFIPLTYKLINKITVAIDFSMVPSHSHPLPASYLAIYRNMHIASYRTQLQFHSAWIMG